MISLEWKKHLPLDKQQAFEDTLRNSTVALSRLQNILNEWEEELNRQETTLKDFDTPNWEVRQAYKLGDRSRIRKLKDLLSFIGKPK